MMNEFNTKENMLSCKQQYEDSPTEELSKLIAKWNNFQMARKIQLNSLYGAMGNKYFRHYRLQNAEAITTTGQLCLFAGLKEKLTNI